jgi:hypothetical protein
MLARHFPGSRSIVSMVNRLYSMGALGPYKQNSTAKEKPTPNK